ncbi:hypothetical protein PsYK624_160150 [Phanerochaete sordida]|uniref:Uncharacterized protein n=1 Tax=Phanerochaete sordida TaxID=48140 RepID=A0A9P3LMI8_9APHY|nr:hypothetical protein PsYK624_160150 [Phanerochaete sordida]
MADYSTTVTIVNRENAQILDLVYSHADQGSWVIQPRDQVRRGESMTCMLVPGQAGTIGRVGYRTFSGTTIKLDFRCSSAGNSVTVSPNNLIGILKYNPTGSPLLAAIFPVEDSSVINSMPPNSSTISVRNGFGPAATTLTRSSSTAIRGNWVTRPRPEIPVAERDVFRLAADDFFSGTSEGRVTYRLESTGGMLEIYFKCSPDADNVVAVTPAEIVTVQYDRRGDLNATIHGLDERQKRPVDHEDVHA